jgi:RNA polymerase-binding transcription factor DksA
MTLTTKQRKYLECRLLEERARLIRDLNRLLDTLSEGDERRRADVHLADLGSDTIEHELIATSAARYSRELGDIDVALDRLRRTPERFGICEITGQDIPFERLDVIPWARSVTSRAA